MEEVTAIVFVLPAVSVRAGMLRVALAVVMVWETLFTVTMVPAGRVEANFRTAV